MVLFGTYLLIQSLHAKDLCSELVNGLFERCSFDFIHARKNVKLKKEIYCRCEEF